MANDRVYIRCKNCNKGMMLAKYYPGTMLRPFVPDYAAENLDPFLEYHLLVCNGYPMFLGKDCGLEFHTEETLPPDMKGWRKEDPDGPGVG